MAKIIVTGGSGRFGKILEKCNCKINQPRFRV